MESYTIRQGQTLFDVALQLYGDVTKVYEIINLNPAKVPNIMMRNLSGVTINYELQSNEIARKFTTDGTVISTQFPEFTSSDSAWSSAFSSSFSSSSTA